MAQRRQGTGRPSKGDRHPFHVRVPRAAAELAMVEADARDLSYSEYIAIIVAQAHGIDMPMPDRVHPIHEQEVLGISA